MDGWDAEELALLEQWAYQRSADGSSIVQLDKDERDIEDAMTITVGDTTFRAYPPPEIKPNDR